MIDDLLEVARSEHRTNAPAARVDVARLARQLLDSATEGTGLEAALRVNGDASILSCPRLLNEVVSNLVSNAVKYNRPGGRLEIEITREDGSIRLDVIDTGIGIDPADIGAIWEPFERLAAEAGEVPGAGLGLAIVANALEELGGSADVTSSPSGTTFSVRLPDAGARSGSADPVSLLLVDDHDAVRSMMDTLLRRAGGFDDIRHARSGAEAVDSVGDDLPSAVLLDRHLPDGLGEALIPRLRALPGAAELPIVILSADVTEAARERSMEAGADAYVVKPARVGDLADLVRSLVVLGRE
jgi:CheY-like chemotaxis protein/anti-sigma regulatory factor (Ser/Thr protein kinase)